MTQRVNYAQQSPALYKKFSEFNLAIRTVPGSLDAAFGLDKARLAA